MQCDRCSWMRCQDRCRGRVVHSQTPEAIGEFMIDMIYPGGHPVVPYVVPLCADCEHVVRSRANRQGRRPVITWRYP